MSQTLSPSQLLEIRRVKAMVAGAGSTINPECFIGPTGPTGPAGDGTNNSFDISFTYTSGSSLSTITLPPNLMTNPTLSAGGEFNADVGSDLVFHGLTSITLNNTRYKKVGSFSVQGCRSGLTGVWRPAPPGSYNDNNAMHFEVSGDNSVIFMNLTASYVSGGNTNPSPSGLLQGQVGAISFTYLRE
jgi:hypothetical protein